MFTDVLGDRRTDLSIEPVKAVDVRFPVAVAAVRPAEGQALKLPLRPLTRRQPECMPKDFALLVGPTWTAARASEREVEEARPGWFEREEVTVERADGRRRQASGLDRASEYAGRDVALGTEGKNDDEIDAASR